MTQGPVSASAHLLCCVLPEAPCQVLRSNSPRLQVVGARGCTLAVVVGGEVAPAGVPAATRCVREEWLLTAAAQHRRPPEGFAALKTPRNEPGDRFACDQSAEVAC